MADPILALREMRRVTETSSYGSEISPEELSKTRVTSAALAAGRVDALEHDRVPSSLAEEHTASPD